MRNLLVLLRMNHSCGLLFGCNLVKSKMSKQPTAVDPPKSMNTTPMGVKNETYEVRRAGINLKGKFLSVVADGNGDGVSTVQQGEVPGLSTRSKR